VSGSPVATSTALKLMVYSPAGQSDCAAAVAGEITTNAPISAAASGTAESNPMKARVRLARMWLVMGVTVIFAPTVGVRFEGFETKPRPY
jgi:hypothetical protein